MEITATVDQDADADSAGQDIVEETGQNTAANRCDITFTPNAEECVCPDACPELQMGAASIARQCPVDATLGSRRYECAQDLEIECSHQDYAHRRVVISVTPFPLFLDPVWIDYKCNLDAFCVRNFIRSIDIFAVCCFEMVCHSARV